MYDLKGITQAEIKECGDALSKLGSGATNMEEVANRIVHHLYDNLGDKETGEKACALVRFYKTPLTESWTRHSKDSPMVYWAPSPNQRR